MRSFEIGCGEVQHSQKYFMEQVAVPYSFECKKGPQPVNTDVIEEKIVDWIFYCSQKSFPDTKSQLLDSVQKFVVQSGKSSPFKKGRPGDTWFMKRHSNISQRISQNLTNVRASITKEEIRSWFDSVFKNFKKRIGEHSSNLNFQLR